MAHVAPHKVLVLNQASITVASQQKPHGRSKTEPWKDFKIPKVLPAGADPTG